jgi:hypothetical protein
MYCIAVVLPDSIVSTHSRTAGAGIDIPQPGAFTANRRSHSGFSSAVFAVKWLNGDGFFAAPEGPGAMYAKGLRWLAR